MNIQDWFFSLPHLWRDELHAMLDGSRGAAALFLNCFPFLLSALWSLSALGTLGLGLSRPRRKLPMKRPGFSVLIPFYGNADAALRTARSLAQVAPAPEEIVLIDDGSPCAITDISLLPPGTRVLRLPWNLGKAAALNHALNEVRSEIIVCLDADTLAETKDWIRMLERFAASPQLGALTGKIRPVRTGNLAQLLQAVDYLAVICMVKCGENLWGGITTVSGAWVAYRREALVQCGGWNTDTSAEDIDLSWRLQSKGWRAGYDHRWTARVEMARTWKGLWLQRRRWSSGMARALREHLGGAFQRGARHLPVALVAVLSTAWMWLCASSLAAGLAVAVQQDPHQIGAMGVSWIQGHALTLCLCAAAFTLQLGIGILVDRAHWKRYPLLILVAPLYGIYFWLVLFTSFVAGFVRGFLRCDLGQWKPTAVCEERAKAAPQISVALTAVTAMRSSAQASPSSAPVLPMNKI